MTLLTELESHLADQLGDAAAAHALAAILQEETLTWRAPALPPQQFTAVFGFTFGNRMLANGNREPGPVNEAIAGIVAALHQHNGARVFAQWEVAAALGNRVPASHVVAINPAHDSRGEPVYLGTSGVIEEIARQAGNPAALGRVGVVAFSDHLYRSVATSRRYGFDAFAPAGVDMPSTYDTESGQAWCRNRIAYLLHDMTIRVTERRAAVVGTMWR